MHGGLFSQDDITIEDIKKIDRNRQPPESGIKYFFFSFNNINCYRVSQ